MDCIMDTQNRTRPIAEARFVATQRPQRTGRAPCRPWYAYVLRHCVDPALNLCALYMEWRDVSLERVECGVVWSVDTWSRRFFYRYF